MFKINIDSDIDKAITELEYLRKRDIPYIMKTTVNNLAFDALNSMKKEISGNLNIYKKSVPSSFRIRKATKSKPYAELYVDEFSWQHKVLAHHFSGGDRERRGMEKALIRSGHMYKNEILTPPPGVKIRSYVYVQMMSQLKLNDKAGYSANETKRSRAKGSSRKTSARFFIITGKSKSPMAPGIYARMPGHDKPLCMLRISEKPHYKKRFDLEATTSKVIARRYSKHLKDAMERASSLNKMNGWH